MRAVLILVLLASCSSGPPSPPSCRSTCTDGCCDEAGECVAGNLRTRCGGFGEKCAACAANENCSADSSRNGTCVMGSLCNPTAGAGCNAGSCKSTDGQCYSCTNASAYCTTEKFGCNSCTLMANGVWCCLL